MRRQPGQVRLGHYHSKLSKPFCKDYAERHKIAFKSVDDLVDNSEIKRFFAERRIERLGAELAGFEKSRNSPLLPKEFTIENGELQIH